MGWDSRFAWSGEVPLGYPGLGAVALQRFSDNSGGEFPDEVNPLRSWTVQDWATSSDGYVSGRWGRTLGLNRGDPATQRRKATLPYFDGLWPSSGRLLIGLWVQQNYTMGFNPLLSTRGGSSPLAYLSTYSDGDVRQQVYAADGTLLHNSYATMPWGVSTGWLWLGQYLDLTAKTTRILAVNRETGQQYVGAPQAFTGTPNLASTADLDLFSLAPTADYWTGGYADEVLVAHPTAAFDVVAFVDAIARGTTARGADAAVADALVVSDAGVTAAQAATLQLGSEPVSWTAAPESSVAGAVPFRSTDGGLTWQAGALPSSFTGLLRWNVPLAAGEVFAGLDLIPPAPTLAAIANQEVAQQKVLRVPLVASYSGAVTWTVAASGITAEVDGDELVIASGWASGAITVTVALRDGWNRRVSRSFVVSVTPTPWTAPPPPTFARAPIVVSGASDGEWVEQRRNLAATPSSANGATVGPRGPDRSVEVTPAAGSTISGLGWATNFTAGDVVSASVDITASAGVPVSVRLTGTGGWGNAAAVTVPAGETVRLARTGTFTANGSLWVIATAANSPKFTASRPLIERAASGGPYFDGATDDGDLMRTRWLGLVNASASVLETREGGDVAIIDPMSATVTKEVNGEHLLEFSLPLGHPRASALVNERRVELSGEPYRIRRVTAARQNRVPAVSVYCEATFYDLAYAGQISAQEFLLVPPGRVLELALAGTGWTVGAVTVTTLRTYAIEDSSPLELLRKVQAEHGGDLVFDGNAQTVSLVTRSGQDQGVAFFYGRGLSSSKRVVDTTSLVTRIRARNAEGVTIASVNGGVDYVEDFTWTEEVREAVYDFASGTSPFTMLSMSQATLANRCKPSYSYEFTVADLSFESGQAIDAFDVADIVTVIDDELDIRVTQRVLRVEHDVMRPWASRITLSGKLRELGSRSETEAGALTTGVGSSSFDLVPFNTLRNGRFDNMLSHWASSGVSVVDSGDGTGDHAARFTGAGVRWIEQTVQPDNRDVYALSLRVTTSQAGYVPNLRAIATVQYEDGTTETVPVDLA